MLPQSRKKLVNLLTRAAWGPSTRTSHFLILASAFSSICPASSMHAKVMSLLKEVPGDRPFQVLGFPIRGSQPA